MSKSFKKWASRIASDNLVWTQSELIYLRKAIGYCGLKDVGERHLLFSLFNQRCKDVQLRILPEHDLLGQNYMLSNSLKRNGSPRKHCILDEGQIKIMQCLSFHAIGGLMRCGGNTILPVYVAFDNIGNWFSYTGTMYALIEIVDKGVHCNMKLVVD